MNESLIKPGMLILAYHKGFHTVVKVIPRQDHSDDPNWQHYPAHHRYTPTQVEYRFTYDSNGKPIKGKGRIYSCAIDYCRPVTTAVIDDMVKEHQSTIDALRAIPVPVSEMAERARRRPSNYNKLSGQEQWDIDKELGILDWDGS